MINSLKLFYPQHSVSLPYLDAVELLKKAPFGVFLSFVDPRTDTLVQKMFPFFYQPVDTYGLKGRCFVTEWEGLHLYIPADLNWYMRGQQNLQSGSQMFRQDLSFLAAGRFVAVDTNVEVGMNIRVDIPFDDDFLPLLSVSGYAHLASGISGAA